MAAPLLIIEDDLSGAEIAELLRYHLEELHRLFPPEVVYALPIEGLRQPEVTFYSAWRGCRLAGCGALKQLDSAHGEIKSMRVAPDHLGKGVGKAVLGRLLSEARDRGLRRVSLETGHIPELLPARTLYESHGFVRCGPFGDYPDNLASVFMTLEL